MLDLKAIFDVQEPPLVRLTNATLADGGNVVAATDALNTFAVSADLPEHSRPLVDNFSAAPAADTKHVARSRWPNPTSDGDWPANVAAASDFVLLLSVDDLPAAPFEFGQAETVVDAAKFLRWLQADAQRGPNGPRAMYGALQSDLQRLRDRLTDPMRS